MRLEFKGEVHAGDKFESHWCIGASESHKAEYLGSEWRQTRGWGRGNSQQDRRTLGPAPGPLQSPCAAPLSTAAPPLHPHGPLLSPLPLSVPTVPPHCLYSPQLLPALLLAHCCQHCPAGHCWKFNWSWFRKDKKARWRSQQAQTAISEESAGKGSREKYQRQEGHATVS